MNDNDKINKVDYRSLFLFGLILNCTGISIMIATRNPAFISFMAFGIILMLNSLAQKDKWNDNNV